MTTLFIATGDSFARVTEQGDEWEVTLSLEGSGVQCLAFDPRQPDTIYAGSRGEGIWKSSGGGTRWSNLSSALTQPDVFSLAVSPADGSVYAGCEPSMLFRSTDGGHTFDELEALRHIPSAPTWSFPPRPWTSHVRWIAPNPHDAALLLVGIELGGVMYSNDGGETFADHRPGAQRDCHALAWHPRVAGRAYEAGGGGAAWSHDGGWTWLPADEGRDRHYTWALAVDPNDADCWFISASTGPRAAHSGSDPQACIYRWRGEGPWQALGGGNKSEEYSAANGSGLPQPLDSMAYALASTDSRLFAGLSDGRIYLSHDKGDSWQLLALRGDTLPGIRAMSCSE